MSWVGRCRLDRASVATLAVLVTYHNERHLLRECLESLVAQPQGPDEVLVYDDASCAPASDYLVPGLPVRVVRGERNVGPVHARNALLRIAQADYVHFHDADDLFRPAWCTRVRAAIDRTRADVVFTEIESRGDHGVLSSRVLGLDRLAREPDLVRFCLKGPVLIPAGTYRRSAVLAIGGYRGTLWQSEDFDFHVRIAALGVRYEVIAEPLVIVRIRAEGRHQKWLEVWASFLQSVEALADELPHQHRPDLADAAARAGSALYKLGAHAQASDAFRLAARLGPPRFDHERRLYRTLAKRLGPERVERLAHTYRGLMPRGLRAYVADRGW
jgi:glycosyltransferase involved in cell wall biosynthesis